MSIATSDDVQLTLEAFDTLRTGYAVFDADDILIYCNKQFRYTYISLQDVPDLVGMRFVDLLRLKLENGEIAGRQAVEDPEGWLRWRLEQHRLGRNRFEERLTDGRWIEIKERRTPSGGTIGQWIDITAAKHAELRLEDAIECTADGFSIWDQTGRLSLFNKRFAARFGSDEAPLERGSAYPEVVRRLAERGAVTIDEPVEQWVEDCSRRRQNTESQFVLPFHDETFYLVRERRTRDGGTAMALTDVTELKDKERELVFRGQSLRRALDEIDMAKQALEDQAARLAEMAEQTDEARAAAERAHARASASEERLKALFSTVGDALVVADPRGVIEQANGAAAAMFGYGEDELTGRGLECLMPDDIGRDHGGHVEAYRETGRPTVLGKTRALIGRRRDGEEFPLEIVVTALRGPEGPTLIASMRDVTERRRYERELTRLAMTDPLTGLPNRRAFVEALLRERERARRYGHPTAALLCDIDHFKRINDGHGHEVGDRALVAFGAAARACLRESDLIARMGGEEFAVLLPETTVEAALASAERLRAAIAALRLPVAEGELRFTVSIGVAALDPAWDDATAVLSEADKALYEAKRLGRDQVRLQRAEAA